MGLIELKIALAPDCAGLCEEVLWEFQDIRWSVQDDALSGSSALIGYFGDKSEAFASWEALLACLSPVGVDRDPEIRDIVDRDWKEAYKEHFHAWCFDRLHWVPVWEQGTYAVPAGDEVLWLDPGMAFGTGNHETTRLCVERLVEFRTARGAEESSLDGIRVVDVGCGSGILALSAAKLGFPQVEAFDNDPEAVRISEENVLLNGLQDKVTFFVADLLEGLQGRKADLLLANIQADILKAHANLLLDALAAGGTLVLSGILAPERDQVRAAFLAGNSGLKADSRVLGEWADLKLQDPGIGTP